MAIVKNKALNSGIWFTVSNFVMKSVGFLTTPIFTRMMSKTEFGDFNNYQTWLMIIMYVTSLDLEASLIRASHEFKDDLNRYVFSMMTLSILSTTFFGLLCIVFMPVAEALVGMNSVYIHSMFWYLLFMPIVNIFQTSERFKYHYKWAVACSLSISIGASLLSVLFVVFMEDKLKGRIIGYITPAIIIGTIILCYYYVNGKPAKIAYWKYALPITLPYIPHLLSMFLLSNMDRVMIKHIQGAEYVALYSLAYTCGMIISILVTSINNAYSPWLAEQIAEKRYDIIKKTSVPYVFVFSFFALGAVLVTPELLYIMGGSAYLEAKYVMPPVAAGCLLQFVYCMYVNIEQYEKKTVGMAFASAIAALSNWILNAIFIPIFGYVAAAYTTYCGYLILLILHMYYVKRIGFSMLYDNRRVFIIAVLSSSVLFMTNGLLDRTVLRYMIIFIYIIVVLVLLHNNKERIYKVLKYR